MATVSIDWFGDYSIFPVQEKKIYIYIYTANSKPLRCNRIELITLSSMNTVRDFAADQNAVNVDLGNYWGNVAGK